MKNLAIILFYLTIIVSFSTNVYSQELIQLTNNSKASQQPCISHSGDFIIYASGIDYTAGGEGSGIWKMNLDGSDQTELLASDGSHNYNHPFINPSDDSVVFSKDRVGGGGGLWILHLSNLAEQRITFNSDYEIGTEWSPNGNEIYFYAGPYGIDSDIKRLCLNNLTIEDVTNGTDKDAFPYLNPDGSKIVFNRVVNKNNFNIFIIDSDGTNLIQVTDNNYKDYIPSWGSDNKIYFSSNRNGTGFDLWRMDTDGKNQERLTDLYGDEKWPEYTKDGIFFYWDKKSDNTGDIWLLSLNQTSLIPTPSPTSLVLSTPSWRNVVSVAGLDNTVFVVEENVTEKVAEWILENGPDHIYTLGFDAGLDNSYEIGHGDVPGLFYPDATHAVLVETKEEGVLGSQIAGLLGIPLVFDGEGYDVIDLRGMPREEMMEAYAGWIVAEGEDTDYLIAANTESVEFPLAARLAKKKTGFIVPVSVPDIVYEMGSWEECIESNVNNGIEDITEALRDAALMLGEKGLFAESGKYAVGEPVYVALIGGFESFPSLAMPDVGVEIFYDLDGNCFYSDTFLSDMNRDGFLDAGLGRFAGGTETISFQIENIRDIEGSGVVIGQYRHPKYESKDFFGGGMTQAYFADLSLYLRGMEVERLVEKRTERPFLPGIDFTSLLGLVFDIGEWLGSKMMGFMGLLLTLADLKETLVYAWLEFDWGDWYWHAGHGGFVELEHLPVFNGTLNLEGVGFLGYFGVGDEFWKIPPEDRDELELITNPYGRCENLTGLDYGGFLYDDHDMSAHSTIVSDVMENGGISFASTGLIHDPFTQRTSMNVIAAMSTGLSVGESLMLAANTPPIEPLIFGTTQNPILKSRPDLYVKDRFEHLVFGDPETSLANTAPQRTGGDEFSISPSGSFLAESQIKSEYYLSGRRLFVENADTEILEIGEPVIPLFVREIILPEGSALEDVSFEGFYRRYWRLEPVIVPLDEHYEWGWEPIEYEDYWFENYTLLDRRVLVRVSVPAVHYGRPSRVLYSGIIEIEYETPVEVSVSTIDIKLGENETIEVTVFNNRDEELVGELFLWVGNESYSGVVEVGVHDTDTLEFVFVPEEAGEYTVKAVLMGNVRVGPRYSEFSVSERCWCGWCWKKHCGCGWLLGILSRTASLRHSMTCG